jgi:hypothetical protein
VGKGGGQEGRGVEKKRREEEKKRERKYKEHLISAQFMKNEIGITENLNPVPTFFPTLKSHQPIHSRQMVH